MGSHPLVLQVLLLRLVPLCEDPVYRGRPSAGWAAVPAAVWKSPSAPVVWTCVGGGWLFAPLSPSFIAGGGSLENIQLFTIQLMYTVAGACG